MYFASISDKIYHDYGDPRAAMKQAAMALQMHCNPVTLKFMAKNLAKIALNYPTTPHGLADRRLLNKHEPLF